MNSDHRSLLQAVMTLQEAVLDLEKVLLDFDPEREHPAWAALDEIRSHIRESSGGEQ